MTASLIAMEDDEDEWVSRQQAAETLGLSVKRVDQLRAVGALASVRNPVTGRVSVRRTSVDRQLALRSSP